jgi:DNA-binding XRE family transcriptional regulator
MKLREARRRKFYSATDLAEKASVSAGTIYAIEAGRELPVLRTARKLADVLEIDPLEVDEVRASLERLSGEPVV